MAMNEKEIEILIGTDGKVKFEQFGYDGNNCSGDINELLKAIGSNKQSVKKKEYFNKQHIRINY